MKTISGVMLSDLLRLEEADNEDDFRGDALCVVGPPCVRPDCFSIYVRC